MKKYLGIVFALVLAVSLLMVPAVPVSANPGGIELVATGDSTATWTAEEKYAGDYSVKLTMPEGNWITSGSTAEVQIDVSGQNLKFSEISDWSFWTLTLTGQESYAVPIQFYADVDGDGTADKIINGNILQASVPVTDEWYEMTPELWKDYGGAFYVWREDGTGFDFSVGDDPWAKAVERWGEATLLRVDLGFGPLGSIEPVTAHIDDLTINGTVYELEPTTGAVDLSAIVPVPPEEQIGISVDQTSISFGSITPGVASPPRTVTVTNIGNVAEDFTASLSNISTPDVYTDGLAICEFGEPTGPVVSAWSEEGVAAQASIAQDLILMIPTGAKAGTYTATLIFWAEASGP